MLSPEHARSVQPLPAATLADKMDRVTPQAWLQIMSPFLTADRSLRMPIDSFGFSATGSETGGTPWREPSRSANVLSARHNGH